MVLHGMRLPILSDASQIPRAVLYQVGSRNYMASRREAFPFSVFGQNLLKDERLEYVDTTGSAASRLMKRGAYTKVKWIF